MISSPSQLYMLLMRLANWALISGVIFDKSAVGNAPPDGLLAVDGFATTGAKPGRVGVGWNVGACALMAGLKVKELAGFTAGAGVKGEEVEATGLAVGDIDASLTSGATATGFVVVVDCAACGFGEVASCLIGACSLGVEGIDGVGVVSETILMADDFAILPGLDDCEVLLAADGAGDAVRLRLIGATVEKVVTGALGTVLSCACIFGLAFGVVLATFSDWGARLLSILAIAPEVEKIVPCGGLIWGGLFSSVFLFA